MADLRLAVARAAAAPFPVLITGESGVGKEVVARAIHRSGPRRLRPFVPLNCAALTDELIETELFGHARGAFTGAVAERRGVFEEADGGTVFLDEVSELSPRAQAKLLRVLQEREIRRVGESFARPVDMRILAASNQSLEHLVGGRTFRPDLRYRLDVIHIHVPALRQRAEDIPALAAEFWQQSSRLVGCRARLGSKLLSALARYEWPGNVRELQNTMASLAVAAPRRGVVGLAQLPASVARTVSMPAGSRLEEARRVFDRRLITGALARAGQRTGPAARELGISRQGLLKMMKRLGVAGGSRGSGSGR
jgi:two-component system response regulator HydG